MAPCINALAQHIDPYDATMLGQVIQGGGKDRKSPKSDANHLSFGLAHRVSWVRVRGESCVMPRDRSVAAFLARLQVGRWTLANRRDGHRWNARVRDGPV